MNRQESQETGPGRSSGEDRRHRPWSLWQADPRGIRVLLLARLGGWLGGGLGGGGLRLGGLGGRRLGGGLGALLLVGLLLLGGVSCVAHDRALLRFRL